MVMFSLKNLTRKKIKCFLLELELSALKHGGISLSASEGAWERAYAMPGYFAERRAGRQERRKRQLYDLIRSLKRQSLLEEYRDGNEKFYRLTARGSFEACRGRLMAECERQKKVPWDGNWRMVLFDVPETKRQFRDYLRTLLKQLGFLQWQRSVWVSPYAYGKEFREHLKLLELLTFVEIFEVAKIPNEERFIKKFKIQREKSGLNLRS
ncbi:MAG: hypothetical protein AAB444_03810 [Patescibacteria group bacterium]